MIGSPWAVILAGGDGLRVSKLTEGGGGRPTPKQYCRFGSPAAMIRWSIERAQGLVPFDRILVVVNEGHRGFWESELADFPRHNLLIQPSNRGTAAAVLLALLTIQMRDAEQSPVIFLPSDHFVANEPVFRAAMIAAVEAAEHGSRDVTLLGLEPGADCRDYGWVLPGSGDRVAQVQRFVEKPGDEHIPLLMDAGGLINTFVFAACAQRFVDVFARALPAFTRRFLVHRRYPIGVIGLHLLYDAITCADLSTDVFQVEANALSVVRVPGCGWSDLGTPERLQAFVANTMTNASAAPGRSIFAA